VAAYPLARSVLAAVLVLTVGAGCVEISTGPTGPDPAPAGGGLRRSGGPPAAEEANAVVQRVLKDVERYWAATYPQVADGAAFKPVQGGYHPYTSSKPPPSCGSEPGQYQPNAFYCPAGDFIAWDAEVLIPQLHADFGPLLVGVVMAHEYGHAVQARLRRTEEPTVVLEQQADCFAGAWTGDIVAGRSDAFGGVSPDQLDSTVAGMLMLRDQPGTAALAPEAHGNAFDRIRAFQEGVEQSATRCASYRSDNIPVTEVPFANPVEEATGGDLPYAKAVPALYDDAQAYWTRTFPKLTGKAWDPVRLVPFEPADPPECTGRESSAGAAAMAAFYCPTGGYLAFDNQQLGPALYQRIGDNAVGMLLGDLFAQAVQERRGRSTVDSAGQLAVDCLAGTWTNDLLTSSDADRIRLSPGDLDEAVAALLVFGRASAGTGASAFDRITEFRNGTLKGLPACE
jgi:predicted metalloprotease